LPRPRVAVEKTGKMSRTFAGSVTKYGNRFHQ
jgi:hypothetical protein